MLLFSIEWVEQVRYFETNSHTLCTEALKCKQSTFCLIIASLTACKFHVHAKGEENQNAVVAICEAYRIRPDKGVLKWHLSHRML